MFQEIFKIMHLLVLVLLVVKSNIAIRSLACFSPLGMKSGAISDKDITSSISHPSEPAHGARLDRKTRWLYMANTNKQPWIQIRLKKRNNITGVATQGFLGLIKQYYLAFSMHGRTWHNYTEDGVVKLFNGNTRPGNIYTVTNNLVSPIVAQYIRLYPTQCVYSLCYCSLRMELYGCDLSPSITTSPPGKPTNMQSTAITNTSITLTWTAPWPAVGDSSINDYTIKYQAEGNLVSTQTETVVQTSATLRHLRPFTVYVVTVRASNNYGTGVESDSVKFKTEESAPEAVPSLTVTSNRPFILAVSWTSIPSDRWNGIPGGYKLKYYKDRSQVTEKRVPQDPRNYEITNLEPNKYYYVEIAGYNKAGIGPWRRSTARMVIQGDPKNSFKTAAIVSICIACAFAVVIVIFCGTWFKKRKTKKRKMETNKTPNINLQVRVTAQPTENALSSGEKVEASSMVHLGNYANLNLLPSGGTNHKTRDPESHTYAKLCKAAPLRMGGGTNTAEVASTNNELIKPLQSTNYENTKT